MGLFSSSSKATSTSTSTDAGTQTGDDSIGVTVTGGTVTVASDTPAVLTYLTGQVRGASSDILDASLDASLGVSDRVLAVLGGVSSDILDSTLGASEAQIAASREAARLQNETASQLNLSLAEGVKDLNLKALETKSATTTARNLLIATVLVILFIAFLFRKSTTKEKKNARIK